jgi:hypothetical protein
MKPFHTIAVPHRDILEGRLTMDVFAADLWEAYRGRKFPEYKDPELFFKKTYITGGLKNLLDVVQKRLKGLGGDPVIQIQTPFGGGKTHALIALFHSANQWGAKSVVLSGTSMSTNQTIWGEIENQIKGKILTLKGNVSPGREFLRKVLRTQWPILILIDEILEYTTRAAGIPVKNSTLAAQTIAFVQELTEVAGILDKICVVITLPSSVLEHYDKNAEKMFNQLQKVSGRLEKIYSPVRDNEIAQVIRRRLFSNVDLRQSESAISEFLEYIERESVLPVGMEVSEYKIKFRDSFPFLPEVIETLYNRWGSLPIFQRTRGVLRLLSLVIYSLKNSSRPYISLADFDLENDDIRRELIKYTGNEFDSVISADITEMDSGSKKVDESLGRSFQGLKIATRAATSIFMYSFSGGVEKGCHLGEIKRSATTLDNPSSVVAEAVEQLKSNLFFLQNVNDKYVFLNRPNLNRILLTKIENVKDNEIVELEHQLLKSQMIGDKLKLYLWPSAPKDIPDTQDLKLVVLPEKNPSFMNDVIERKGELPRINRNIIFFLTPIEGERSSFLEVIKRRIAYEDIDSDKTLSLSDAQRNEIRNNMKKDEEMLSDAIRRFYRVVYVPIRNGFKPIELGIPTYGESKSVDYDVYDKLRSEEEILENVATIVIKERYLGKNDYVKVQQIYDSMLKTPGESRVISLSKIESAIRTGVKQGQFGLGEIDTHGKVACTAFREDTMMSIEEMDLLVSETLCNKQRESTTISSATGPLGSIPGDTGYALSKEILSTDRRELILRFKVPRGRISDISRTMNYIQTKFQSLEIEIKATDGYISEEDYTNKIKEALLQLGIDLSDKFSS